MHPDDNEIVKKGEGKMERWNQLWENLKRLKYPLIIGVGALLALIFIGQGRYIISVLSVLFKLSVAFVFFHCIWETFFGYFRLGEAYQEGRIHAGHYTSLFKTIATFRAILLAAWLLAFALAL